MLHPIADTPPGHGNDVVYVGLVMVFSIDASSVVRHLFCCQRTAPDGTVCVDFRHHLFPPGDGAVVANFPKGVVLDDTALFEFGACSALVKLVTLLVLGLVVAAGLVGDAARAGVLPPLQVVARLPGAGAAAVDDVLR